MTDPRRAPQNTSALKTSALKADTAFFGHPRGLAYLAFTEAWERFSFSGMQTLLVLYMVGQLLQPGHIEHVAGFGALRGMIETVYGPMAAQPLASVIFGLYTSLVFFTPVIGGLLGDRVVGQHRMVMIGALFMAAGHFLMAFEASFVLALILLILGCGCLKGNISTQVGSLYADDDRRRTDAFQIFSVGINVGIIVAPLICGTLGELYGWHYGFGAAGVGMLIGLVIYMAGARNLPPDRIVARSDAKVALMPKDKSLVGALVLAFVLVTCFLVSAGQLGNVYNLWLKTDIDRSAFGLTVPVTWFHMLTPLFSAILTPLFLARWKRDAARGTEPSMMAKMGWGLAMAAAAMLLMAVLAWLDQTQKISWVWLLFVHVLVSSAYLFVWPVGLALFSRAAPAGARAMFIGIFFLSSFVASNLIGGMGALYATLSHHAFWLMQAGVGAGGAVLALIFGPLVSRALARDAAGAPTPA